MGNGKDKSRETACRDGLINSALDFLTASGFPIL